MVFDVELTFTGLGLVLLRSGGRERNPNPDSIEFLLLRTAEPETIGSAGLNLRQEHSRRHDSGRSHSAASESHGLRDRNSSSGLKGLRGSDEHGDDDPVHLPRLWFRLDDLAEPERRIFPELAVGTDGAPIIGLDLRNQDFTIEAPGQENSPFEVVWAEDPNAVAPADPPSQEAIDWIPDLESQFGIKREFQILPGHSQAERVYTTRVTLPPGRITTRRFLVDRNRTPTKWTFGDRPGRVLADQVVWSRKNVSSLKVNLFDGLVFDAIFRETLPGQENPKVTLALTNLPASGRAGRFRRPTHFPHYRDLSKTAIEAFPEINGAPGDITSGGACPPARTEA